MHILVTNDDGPPKPSVSPYVVSLVRALQKAGHTVSVCLPASQRSWIGKAHIIGQTVKPTYYRPPAVFDPRREAPENQGSTHSRPSRSPDVEEWVLADGSPASCAQLGIYHFFQERGPVDLVVSGPNYGRNTTAVFGLSSGTMGAALEATVCLRKAVALSYGFFRDQHDPHDPVVIDQASAHSVRIIEKLYELWPADKSVDLYSVNVPLLKGVAESKVLYTEMLQNYWREGHSCFQEVEGSVGDPDEEEEKIREAEGRAPNGGDREADREDSGMQHRHFKWAPQQLIDEVNRSINESAPGNDGWAVMNGHTSVTPIKANFCQAATHLHGQELILDAAGPEAATTQEQVLSHRPKDHFYALIDYEDPYVQPLILSALKKRFPSTAYTLLPPPAAGSTQSEIPLGTILPTPDSRVLQITPYEVIDWEFVAEHENTCLVNSYMLRKALIRKHYLGSTVENWVAKRPDSVLKTHVMRSENFELDYAEFLDDALVEAFELRASLERNEDDGSGQPKDEKDREWWILKPGMSDRGQGIRLFSTMEELQGIFDEWEADQPDSDEEEEEEEEEDDAGAPRGGEEGKDYITTSHLRHFVAQPYIQPPLLLPGTGDRKFHIRTYVLCAGSLDVYVYRDMLALFASKPYAAPWEHAAGAEDGAAAIDLEAHLTNTCLQRSVSDGTVRRFWDLEEDASAPAPFRRDDVFAQVCAVTGEVFEAAARGMLMHFRPLPNAFEVYGLDFLVDAAGTAWLLEVNAFPDFKQTGADLRELVQGLWDGVVDVAVGGFLAPGAAGSRPQAQEAASGAKGSDAMVHVRHVDLGRGW